VIGTLGVDGWAAGCYIWYSEEGRGELLPNVTAHPSTVDGWAAGCYIWYSEEGRGELLPNVTAHPSTASVPTSYYSMRHCNCL